jgi:hypothetical protein
MERRVRHSQVWSAMSNGGRGSERRPRGGAHLEVLDLGTGRGDALDDSLGEGVNVTPGGVGDDGDLGGHVG